MTADSSTTWPRQVGIVGVGLLGGSVAMSIRRIRPDVKVLGFARSQTAAERLQSTDVVDIALTSLQDVCRDSDVIVIATPVDRIAPLAIEAASYAPADCLITDVGSTKEQIVRDVESDAATHRRFIAAHPIAGSEKSGADYASEDLFDRKVIVLTPDSHSDPELLRRAEAFWRLTGGQILQMTPADHDTHLAAVSHVPHLVSALVARMISPESRSLVGSGWRDITRVAAGDPDMWTAICRENRPAILRELAVLANELSLLRNVLQGDDDEIRNWLAEAKRIKQETD